MYVGNLASQDFLSEYIAPDLEVAHDTAALSGFDTSVANMGKTSVSWHCRQFGLCAESYRDIEVLVVRDVSQRHPRELGARHRYSSALVALDKAVRHFGDLL